MKFRVINKVSCDLRQPGVIKASFPTISHIFCNLLKRKTALSSTTLFLTILGR